MSDLPERDDLPLDDEGLIRLQKLLALAGIASRRGSEILMLNGSVEVNGEVVTRLGTKVDPGKDVVRVDGKRLPRSPARSTWPSTSRVAWSRR